jgi:DNA-binding GntR family transcriptional regulator
VSICQVYLLANYRCLVDSSEDAGRPGKADQVYARLRADIEAGVLAPGRTIPEIELVAYTGASRTPVREAVRRLAGEGLIELEPRRAPTVSRISLRSARALFEFRGILEPAAIRMVAARAAARGPLRDSLLALEERFRTLEGSEYSPGFQEEFGAVTSQFDALLAASAPNEYLRRAIVELRPHSTRLRLIAHSDRARLNESIAEHLEMCAAVLAGDPERASAAMTQHLTHVSESILRSLLSSDAELLLP